MRKFVRGIMLACCGREVAMSKTIERLENLIRVVSSVPEGKFDIRYWYDRYHGCGCAIGHAIRDPYFIKEGLGNPIGANSYEMIGDFFDIDSERASQLFSLHIDPRYETRQDVLSALRVLLLEKQVQSMRLAGFTPITDVDAPMTRMLEIV